MITLCGVLYIGEGSVSDLLGLNTVLVDQLVWIILKILVLALLLSLWQGALLQHHLDAGYTLKHTQLSKNYEL